MNPMRVLIGYASRHGGTAEIAARIAETVGCTDVNVELRPFGEIPETSVAGFDAFILGSSVYMGRWDREAMAFVRRHQGVLRLRPVWLFSSGPLGDQPLAGPSDLEELRHRVHFRAHRLFRGVLKPERMSLGERLLARAMKVSGDYRDWAEIEEWAGEIRTRLATGRSVCR